MQKNKIKFSDSFEDHQLHCMGAGTAGLSNADEKSAKPFFFLTSPALSTLIQSSGKQR